MKEAKQSLDISVALTDVDHLHPDDVDRMARNLRSELTELSSIEKVELAAEQEGIATGAKGAGEAVTIGALVIAVLPTAIPALFEYLKEWTLRPGASPLRIKVQEGDRTLEAEFDPKRVSQTEVESLVEKFQTIIKRQD